MWDEDHPSTPEEVQAQAEVAGNECSGQEDHLREGDGVLGEAEAGQGIALTGRIRAAVPDL